MLILARKEGQEIRIDGAYMSATIRVVQLRPTSVRLGVQSTPDVTAYRAEIADAAAVAIAQIVTVDCPRCGQVHAMSVYPLQDNGATGTGVYGTCTATRQPVIFERGV